MPRYLLILLAAGLLTRCASMEGTDGKTSPAPAADPDAAPGSRRSPLTTCGNGVCEQGEIAQTCPGDCPAAVDATNDSSPSASTGCKATNQTGCDGCACEACVCALDAYCCQTEWDAQCASECANNCNGLCASTCGNGKCDPGETVAVCPVDCSVTTGAGCTPSNKPGCPGCACESCVCAMDSYCCEVAWDPQCVGECATSCGGCKASECGDGQCDSGETPTSCPADCSSTTDQGCIASPAPGCNGCACEQCVCALDSYCCTTSWDSQCVAECAGKCNGTCTIGKCGDGTCDPGESHASCPKDCGELVQCIEKDCGGEWLACQMSAGCQDYTACRALCGTKAACAANCQAKVDAVDLALFATLETCAGTTCLPEAAACSLSQNKCNGLVLTYCGAQGQMVTTTCDDACAKDGFGPATSCGKNEAGIDRCFCQDKIPGACTTQQNKCNGNVLTFCNTQGQMATLTCSDGNCAKDGFGPLIGCKKSQAGFDQCICQEALPEACTAQQNKCNGIELTWCDTSTGKLSTTTCTDKLCQDAGFGSLDGCAKGANGYDICVCKPKP